MKDEAVIEAISGESEWMESLLVRLVEAPTVLGNEEAGQEIMAEAFRECGFMTGFRRRKPISFSDGLAGANGAISLVQRELPLRTLITECWRLREEGSLVKHLPNKGLSFRARKPSALSERVKLGPGRSEAKALGEDVRLASTGADLVEQGIPRALAVGGFKQSIPLDEEAIGNAEGSSPFSWSVAGKRNVVAHWPGAGHKRRNGSRSPILNGHIDVVPPAAEELWTNPPFRAVREGDWLYGRGAGDMKAGLVAMTGAVRGLAKAGASPGALQLQSVVEEECTGHGSLQCLLDGSKADACVIAEPHPDHITVVQVGVLWFHVEIAGVPAHAARAASRLGFNAIAAACEVLDALRKLEARLNEEPPHPFDNFDHPINLNPGVISGGDWASTVAASCTLSCRIGLFPGQSPEEMKEMVEEAVAEAAAKDPRLAEHPPEVRYDGFACEGSVVDEGEPLVASLSGAYARLHGERPPAVATTATTDARHFVRHGMPAVCFGPRAERIHGIDERVSLRSVMESAQVLGLFIKDWCGLV